jgi:hypothetical protein
MNQKTFIHLQAFIGTSLAVLFLVAPAISCDLFFTKGRAALTHDLQALLVSYAGILIVAVGALCSAKLTKETAQGIGFAYLCLTACMIYVCLQPTTAKLTWSFVAIDLATGGYLLGTAGSLPGKQAEPSNTHHKHLLHLQAGVGTLTALGFIFAQGIMTSMFFTRGAAVLTPELRDTAITMGGVLIVSAGALCSVRVNKETAQGVGTGFIVAMITMAYVSMQPTTKPLAWTFVALDGVTALYFLATAGSLASHYTAPTSNTTKPAANVEAAPAKRETRSAKKKE